MNRTHSIAMFSAMLAQHYGKKKLSAFNAAEIAIALTGAANAIADVETFACNGYKTEREDSHMARLCREGKHAECNEYAERLQREGAAYVEKRRAQINKRIAKILASHGLPSRDFKQTGIYGGLRFVADGRDWSIAA